MLAFNVLCTYAWANVFCVEIKHLVNYRLPEALYVSAWPELEGPLLFAQSLAVLEVLHSLLGGFVSYLLLVKPRRRREGAADI